MIFFYSLRYQLGQFKLKKEFPSQLNKILTQNDSLSSMNVRLCTTKKSRIV